MLPGHERYQPQSLVPYLDYASTSKWWANVEIAALEVMAKGGHFNPALLTTELQQAWRTIPMAEVDKLERKIGHDIQLVSVHISNPADVALLKRFIHLGLTSFDVRDTAEVLAIREATCDVILPLIRQLMDILITISLNEAETVQIGRTHLQHAEPITVGFGLSQIVHRLGTILKELERATLALVGKISGAVGAYNSLSLIDEDPEQFELDVLAKFDLQPALISTQILPPEPLAMLYNLMTSGSQVLANWARNFRRLGSTEVGEIGRIIDPNSVSSSTMPHKTNPVTEENTESLARVVKNMYGVVLDNIISEHERDLCGSASSRFALMIPVLFTYQLERVIKYFDRFKLNYDRIAHNFVLQGDLIMAEPLYILLELNDYPGDAHEDVKQLTIQAREQSVSLMSLAEASDKMKPFIEKFTDAQMAVLLNPVTYTGIAPLKVKKVCAYWQGQLGLL